MIATEHRVTAAGFHCSICQESRPPSQSSPDPRYCQPCYSDLLQRVKGTIALDRCGRRHQVATHTATSPIRTFDFEVGDRVRSLHIGDQSVDDDGDTNEVDPCWLVVYNVWFPFLACLCPNGRVRRVSASSVFAHQKFAVDGWPKPETQPRMVSPLDNLIRCRELLVGMLKIASLDSRVLLLWRSKAIAAEALCLETGTDAAPKPLIQARPHPRTPALALMAELRGEEHVETFPILSQLPKPGKHPAPCACGCGKTAAPGRVFCHGHATTFRYRIARERGELPSQIKAKQMAGMRT